MKIDGKQLVQTHNKIPLHVSDAGLVVGEVAAISLDLGRDPDAKWTGSPIPSGLIRKCVAFARWCSNEYGGEVQGRLYYDKKTKAWATTVVKQFVSRSLESKEEGTDGNIEEALVQLPKGKFVQMGTWHSHEKAQAFQSTTDYADEIKQNGLHITVGNVMDDNFSVHARITHMGINYDKGDGEELVSDKLNTSTKKLPRYPHGIWIKQLVERKKVAAKKYKHAVPISGPSAMGGAWSGEVSSLSQRDCEALTGVIESLMPGESVEGVCRALIQHHQSLGNLGFGEQGTISTPCIFCGMETTDPDGVCQGCYEYMN